MADSSLVDNRLVSDIKTSCLSEASFIFSQNFQFQTLGFNKGQLKEN